VGETIGSKGNISDEELPLPELEANLVALGSDIAAAEARWLLMLAVFDRRGGWAGTGVASCAHWLSWRLGFSLIAAREKVRVARALEDLPATSEAFEKGELSYCRARAITRVATPGTETSLLDMARHSTGAQLERIVRATSGALRQEEVDERAFRRNVSWHWDHDGSLLVNARLDPTEGAAFISAMEAAQAADPADGSDELPADGDTGKEAADSVAEDVAAPEDRVAAEAAAEVATGTATIAVDAMGRPLTVGDLAAERRQGRVDAFVRLAENYIAAVRPAAGADVYQVVVHVKEDAAPYVEDGPALPIETAMRLSCDATLYCIHVDAKGKPKDAGRQTRSVRPPMRRALNVRDGGCRFPGCGRRRRVDAHHVKHWACGGPTCLANLLLLCRRHHMLVHEGGFGLYLDDNGQPVFSCPDGSPLPEVPGSPLSAMAPHQWHRRKVEPNAISTRWLGERLDLDAAVSAVLQARVAPTPDGSEGTR
jgi:Domain of unknown function (DUF222)